MEWRKKRSQTRQSQAPSSQTSLAWLDRCSHCVTFTANFAAIAVIAVIASILHTYHNPIPELKDWTRLIDPIPNGSAATLSRRPSQEALFLSDLEAF